MNRSLEKIVGGAMTSIGSVATIASAYQIANEPQNIFYYGQLIASLACTYYGIEYLSNKK